MHDADSIVFQSLLHNLSTVNLSNQNMLGNINEVEIDIVVYLDTL